MSELEPVKWMTWTLLVWDWIRHHIGRRGAFLSFLAILDVAYGYSLLSTEAPQRLVNLLLPWWVWGWIWIGVGAVCATGVPMHRDRIQYTTAAVMKVAWGLLYLNVQITQPEIPRAWVAVVIWLPFAAVVLVVAGWPESPPLPPMPPKPEVVVLPSPVDSRQ